jgi:hypothetical protein
VKKKIEQTAVEMNKIQTKIDYLKGDPILNGMSPLYKDYESKYWWFELSKFASTLILCGFVTLIPAEGASQIFISLATSMTMMLLFANCNPYLSPSDDFLAQFCQVQQMHILLYTRNSVAMAVPNVWLLTDVFASLNIVCCPYSFP